MLLNTLKNKKFKKTQKNPLEARFYWFFLGGFFNANPALSQIHKTEAWRFILLLPQVSLLPGSDADNDSFKATISFCPQKLSDIFKSKLG